MIVSRNQFQSDHSTTNRSFLLLFSQVYPFKNPLKWSGTLKWKYLSRQYKIWSASIHLVMTSINHAEMVSAVKGVYIERNADFGLLCLQLSIKSILTMIFWPNRHKVNWNIKDIVHQLALLQSKTTKPIAISFYSS